MGTSQIARELLTATAEDVDLYLAFSDLLSENRSDYGYSIEDLRNVIKFGSYDDTGFFAGYDIGAGSSIIYFDQNDVWAMWALDKCLALWVTGSTAVTNYDVVYESYSQAIFDRFGIEYQSAGRIAILEHFVSSEYIFDDDTTLELFAALSLQRIEIWNNYYIVNESWDYEALTLEEERLVSENVIEDSPEQNPMESSALDLLTQLGNKAFSFEQRGYNSSVDYFLYKAFGDRERIDKNVSAFYRVFSQINPVLIDPESNSGVGSTNVKDLLSRLEAIGFFELASYAGEIAEYARRRTSSTYNVEQSAQEFIDVEIDTPWLLRLTEMAGVLRQSPILFSSIIYYFPSWATFFIDALALVGDYSNDGRGGDPNDPINNPAIYIDSLEKAFGTGENGRAVFQLAITVDNTVQRLQKVLNPEGSMSWFRKNTAPKNPDIFHLRLGAANFYVPPVSIDINSTFKAGSLMPGAIRQNSSPKFNSGYKETIIRMRIFFPNYEEVWGINIDDGSSINLNDEFVINFSANGDSDAKIDKFLSSLRGLVAAFKYSPFVPVKNHYLNAVHGISAVGFSNMTISTIPNFPFALAVDLELVNFNHKPFLPMIKDFNQAIHWGKYRQYMGRAAGQLNRYVNESFLLKNTDSKVYDDSAYEIIPAGEVEFERRWQNGQWIVDTGSEVEESETVSEPDPYADDGKYNYNILKTNVIEQWLDGNNLTFYIPAEAQTKIFLPSIASFRTDEEKIMHDLGGNAWNSILGKLKIDVDESESYGLPLADVMDISRENAYSKSAKRIILDSIDIITAGINSDNDQEKVYDYFITNFIIENNLTPKPGSAKYEDQKVVYDWLKDRSDLSLIGGASVPGTYTFQGQFISNVTLIGIKRTFINISQDPREFLDFLVDTKIADAKYKYGGQYNLDYEKTKQDIVKAFNVSLYERFFKSGPIQSLMEAARARAGAFQFNEWEVPMLRVDMDPEFVIINAITVTMGNNLVKLQVQMLDEPTYQHIGGKDSYINISMTVIGEQELIKLKNIFDHISGLARLEHSTGVIGFLGIKNIITALAGIKYVMPLNYRVSTRPNFPHIYDIELTLIDFDIFQQKREKLSSKQQRDLIEHFGTKRNPFLRIKQLWSSFNAYPDLPLEVKNNLGETVGHLDPDFYFRSFEMFDRDVINNVTYDTPRIEEFRFQREPTVADIGTIGTISSKILDFLRIYTTGATFNGFEFRPVAIADGAQNIEGESLNNLLSEITTYLRSNNISKDQFIDIFYSLLDTPTESFTKETKINLLTDFISFGEFSDENNPYLTREADPSPFVQGNISPSDMKAYASLEAALQGEFSLEGDTDVDGNVLVSFHPDEVDFHKQIFMIPSASEDDLNNSKIPSILNTSIGVYYGYVDKRNGRFYLTVGGDNVTRESSDAGYAFTPNIVEDTSSPDRGTTNALTGVGGMASLSEYQKPYQKSTNTHWETMMVDASYRDVSGRMVRAFPTYMLWLIDEGGYFAGVKMFDNFYGLQSIIDFSIVSSEDLLGDTLIFRVSNLYSKLTKKESSSLFSVEDDYNTDSLSLQEGLGGIIDRTLNMSRNIVSGLRNEYIVEISNIRLKPGVRVHLRVGYGSNPNSLQTVFNGVITNVEQGEIVTVTAQSDAIELGAVVNSTDQKGHSGKIDGGIDTGMYLSEPRDLMVRLLSMGSSRTREAIAHATRGNVFSENKFGIRHFGTIVYEPLNSDEKRKNDAVRDNISAAFGYVGGSRTSESYSANFRDPSTLDMVGQLWANFSADIDLELFKRNIYPGNGLGIAQFLGGDIDDGWATVSSIKEEEVYNDRIDGYLGRLTDQSFNRLMQSYEQGNDNASATLESIVSSNKLISAEGRAGLVKAGLSATGVAIGLAATAVMPITGGVLAGASLLGLLSGRGGTNIFRTMGLISQNSDDDLPGYDEVSFRAQTYMRTVWDLFQTCARMLPNYIVAVRPFEDRSTVFYGKPHWLYTSGVVPVTTGFPSEEKARELGISSGPANKGPDQVLSTLLDNINKNTNPLADYGAYFQNFEPNETFKTVSEQITTSSGIYKPSAALAGKVLNFYSGPANNYYDTDSRQAIAKLPKNHGIVSIGPHLPVISKEFAKGNPAANSTIQSLISDQVNLHDQIDQLPPRYGWPYYAVSENLVLKNSSSITVSPFYYPFIEDESTNPYYSYNNLDKISMIEANFFANSNLSLFPNIGEEGAQLNYDQPLDLKSLYTDVEQNITLESVSIMMPIPLKKGASSSQIDETFSFEYDINNIGLNYSEWGAPETTEDEMFYIAMRWPYNPTAPENDPDNIIDQFKQVYGFDELYGNVDDYKKRKVLVYNPNNGRAVVCKPAYFLWGEGDINLPQNDSEFGEESDYYIPKAGVDQVAEDGEKASTIDARVSPDAAFFLGVLTLDQGMAARITGTNGEVLDGISLYSTIGLPGTADGGGWRDGNDFGNEELDVVFGQLRSGYFFSPVPQECFFAFVPDSIPVGVVSTTIAPVNSFKLVNAEGSVVETNEENYIVGFGNFKISDGEDLYAQETVFEGYTWADGETQQLRFTNDSLSQFRPYQAEYVNVVSTLNYAGNPLNIEGTDYFKAVLDKDYGKITQAKLDEIKESEGKAESNNRVTFLNVYDPADMIGIQARSYFDENYDNGVSVIAGNGRTLVEAQEIWDQFRAEYHTYDSVKRIFFDLYGLDPDSEQELPSVFKKAITGTDFSESLLQKYGDSAVDEFSILLGSDYYSGLQDNSARLRSDVSGEYSDALDFMKNNYIDASIDEGGLIEYYNRIIDNAFKKIKLNFFTGVNIEGAIQFSLEAQGEEGLTSAAITDALADSITTPKQLFLLMVGIFRQRMWEDPYARAWLVLKPDKKPGFGGYSGWSFRSVDPIFRAFLDPYQDYAKPSQKAKFLKLLVSTRAEGNSSSTIWSSAVDGVESFVNRTVGPMITAIGDALSGLTLMFKTSMQQLGYALSEVGNFKRQANILNKALNDSIYYSLGRPGTLLRAVDNPFTREYGEPVLEIREPFQRLHFISSFSHILSNQIQENINGVATVVTAVSDGKYPVSVALDKGAPAERQVEKTVETGIYYDNVSGSGLTGVLHPLFHPLETIRGVAKTTQGTPDELTSKRIALAHLKESIKDIYGGELIVIGNADIRPHDLVYLSDVYERMYGIFEVEQVVHHFTPEMGFITSITPNALVTVNDPARWFMTSWMQSWMHVQNVRNDARIYLDNIRNANTIFFSGGNVSVEKMSEMLSTQITGGFQFTHGSSALVKDIVANQTAQDSPGVYDRALSNQVNEQGGAPTFAVISSFIPGLRQTIWSGWKWIRDNVLDQHGCYVQYLNKNGQPMDAGLSFNQGMVVGQHHSTALLPGILGVRTKTRTPEGNAYIRSDDLLRSLGWNETEVAQLVKHISYEAALVHSRVSSLAGLGPEKASFEWKFKVICKVIDVLDGDTIEVEDVISKATFRIRFDGINTSETNVIQGKIAYPDTLQGNTPSTVGYVDGTIIDPISLNILDLNTPGGKAKLFVKDRLKDKIFIARINQTRTDAKISRDIRAELSQDFEAGSQYNNIENYQLDIFGNTSSNPRALGTIFYRFSQDTLDSSVTYVANIFKENISNLDDVKSIIKNDIYSKSPFNVKFESIYNAINESGVSEYDGNGYEFFELTEGINSIIYTLSSDRKKMFGTLVYFKILEEIYNVASQWPLVSWDEYYPDGYPITLNWELVVNNLAKVYVADLQKESESVQDVSETAASLTWLNL